MLYVLKEIKVETVIVGKQYESCENYEEFQRIVNAKKINVHIVEAGNKIRIDNSLYFYVLWPTSTNMISDNAINNNSLVCKLIYKNFSMLFTGDIEEIAEKAILSKYVNNQELLNADILKVAHHGSKTSSIKEFINTVSPKYAVIGVGKDNKFGHPSENTLKTLENGQVKIFRTDISGEIMIITDGNNVRINEFYDTSWDVYEYDKFYWNNWISN